MPEEVYTINGFNWHGTQKRLTEAVKNRRGVFGDTSDEAIAYTKGVLCLHVTVEGEKVAFSVSPYGKVKISHPNNKLLRKARTKLKSLIVGQEWAPRLPARTRDRQWSGSVRKQLPEDHVMRIVSGLSALANIGGYYTEGGLPPGTSDMEHALQHLITGYLPIYRLCKEVVSEMEEHKADVGKLQKLAEKAGLLTEKVRAYKQMDGWCKVCEETRGKRLSQEEEDDVKRVLWLLIPKPQIR